MEIHFLLSSGFHLHNAYCPKHPQCILSLFKTATTLFTNHNYFVFWTWNVSYQMSLPTMLFNPLTTVYFRSIIYHSGPMDPNRIIWYTSLAKWLQCFISLLCCLLAIKVLVVMHLEFQLLFLYLKFLLRNCTMWHVHAEYYITVDIIGVLR